MVNKMILMKIYR